MCRCEWVVLYIYEWVPWVLAIPYIWMSPMSIHMNESCYIHEWVLAIAHTWMSSMRTYMNESYEYTYEWVVLYIRMSPRDNIYMNEFYKYIYQWVLRTYTWTSPLSPRDTSLLCRCEWVVLYIYEWVLWVLAIPYTWMSPMSIHINESCIHTWTSPLSPRDTALWHDSSLWKSTKENIHIYYMNSYTLFIYIIWISPRNTLPSAT